MSALAANFRAISRHVAPAEVMCVVKANAYGHGLIECARQLEKAGTAYFGVARLQEGIELRQAGIKTPILVFGGLIEDEIEYFVKHDLDLTASSADNMKAICDTARKLSRTARVHIKVDTGLNRIGVSFDSAPDVFQAALQSEWCTIAGVYTHLAAADAEDFSFTSVQLERFKRALRFFEERHYPMPLRHMANSAATVRSKECHLELVRPGLALYGVYPAEQLKQAGVNLVPVLSLKSKVAHCKVVPEGHGVSYCHTWTAPKDTRVVTIPVGYGDGYMRCLSNRADVLIRGRRYRIVGNICMDQFMVAINEDEASIGDEVVLIGSQGKETITVEELAGLAQTVEHEILPNLNLRIPRSYRHREPSMLGLDRVVDAQAVMQ